MKRIFITRGRPTGKAVVVTTRLSNAQRSRQTRRTLLDVGWALFADMGYARTTTEELVRRTGVTRGALYYHFRDKNGLFKARVRGSPPGVSPDDEDEHGDG